MSRYRAIRVILTTQESNPAILVHVSVKPYHRPYDEWTALMPYLRLVPERGINSSRDALLALRDAIDAALLDLG